MLWKISFGNIILKAVKFRNFSYNLELGLFGRIIEILEAFSVAILKEDLLLTLLSDDLSCWPDNLCDSNPEFPKSLGLIFFTLFRSTQLSIFLREHVDFPETTS